MTNRTQGGRGIHQEVEHKVAVESAASGIDDASSRPDPSVRAMLAFSKRGRVKWVSVVLEAIEEDRERNESTRGDTVLETLAEKEGKILSRQNDGSGGSGGVAGEDSY